MSSVVINELYQSQFFEPSRIALAVSVDRRKSRAEAGSTYVI